MTARTSRHGSRVLRAFCVSGLAATVALGAAQPAEAHVPPGFDSVEDTWGGIDPAVDAFGKPLPPKLRADSWLLRVNGIKKLPKTPLIEARYPARKDVPGLRRAGDKVLGIKTSGVPVGKVSSHFARALGGKLPSTKRRNIELAAPGASYADVGGGTLDVRIPQDTGKDKKPVVIGVHLERATSSALSKPGQPVKFTSSMKSGAIYVGQKKVVDLTKKVKPNTRVVIPGTDKRSPYAVATINEMKTTTQNGEPTKTWDEKATSGYANAVHLTIFGSTVTDVTIGHSAVIGGGEAAAPAGKTPAEEPVDKTKPAAGEHRAQEFVVPRPPACPPDDAIKDGSVVRAPQAQSFKVGMLPPFPPPECVPVDPKTHMIKGKPIDTTWWIVRAFADAWNTVWGWAGDAVSWVAQGASDVWDGFWGLFGL
ncbi:hypothetical protein ACQB60_06675 [Actinomycetota bacterium Odt1-20B]